MADPRPHRPLRAAWAVWFAVIALVTAAWAAGRFDARGDPSRADLPVLWLSPAPLVVLAGWWHGRRGAAVSLLAVAGGALAHAELLATGPYRNAEWVAIALAAVAGPVVAASVLGRAGADLRRPGVRDTARFVVVVVIASVVSALATAALVAVWGDRPRDRSDAIRSLAVTDLSTIVVVVPVAFVLRGAHARRRGGPGRRLRRVPTSSVAAVYLAVLAGATALVLGISNGGTRVDIAIGASLLLAVVALVEERRRSAASARRTVGDLGLDRARFRSLVDDSPEGVLLLDALGRIESVNRGAADIFGSVAEDLVGRSLIELLPVPSGVDPATHLVDVLGSRGVATTIGSAGDRAPTADVDRANFALDLSVARVDVDGRWGYIATVRDGRDRRRWEQGAGRRITHDALTDLPNRALFQDRLEQAVDALRHRPGELVLLLVALDRRAIDDARGYAAGDEMFAAAARRLTGAMRESDTVARVGDDRLAVLCRAGSEPGEATSLASRVVALLSGPIEGQPADAELAAYVGVAATTDPDTLPDRFLRDAESALVRAKRGSAGSWRAHQPSSSERAATIDLREPLSDDQVVLRYQPMLDLETGRVTSVEALARLRADDGSLIMPDDFVPLWERSGLVVQLGEIVLRQALQDLVSLRTEIGSERLRVAVNISPHQLEAPLCDLVRAALARHELAPASLLLEITETAPIDAMPDAVEVLRQLHALGVSIALDDFGTGCTRLDQIRDLPIDTVKIDPSFVSRMVDTEIDRDIVETIVALARRRHLTVIAEGVEQVEQVEALSRLGCSQAQGFLFGRPVDVDELRYLLREWHIVPAIATAFVKYR
jgi:diguanylate cyclase (GGDEF)-like protein